MSIDVPNTPPSILPLCRFFTYPVNIIYVVHTELCSKMKRKVKFLFYLFPIKLERVLNVFNEAQKLLQKNHKKHNFLIFFCLISIIFIIICSFLHGLTCFYLCKFVICFISPFFLSTVFLRFCLFVWLIDFFLNVLLVVLIPWSFSVIVSVISTINYVCRVPSFVMLCLFAALDSVGSVLVSF